MAKTVLTFSKSGDYYTATCQVTGNFAVHLESNQRGLYIIEQKSDPDATRSAVTDSFTGRKDLDEQYQVLLAATITVKSDVPISYGSIIQ